MGQTILRHSRQSRFGSRWQQRQPGAILQTAKRLSLLSFQWYTPRMYFKSRVEAGQKLGEQIAKKYQGQQCAVVGLSDGGVMVGAQIAIQLHCVLTLLQSEA